GKDKHLMNYRIEPWRLGTKRPWKIITTEQDLEDVINRASYLAKTRSKRIGAGQVTISTSRLRA
ncbi:MAG TPA: hypothetical protein VFW58_11890, partial [Trichococcus sp.]|nr:hypothetical protein [Trichococcus sp.]